MTRRVLKSSEEQVALWVTGQSLHSSHRRCGEECCPDFSCCHPELRQPISVRRAFQAADDKQRSKYLMIFLGGMLAKKRPDVRVHITGGEPEVKS